MGWKVKLIDWLIDDVSLTSCSCALEDSFVRQSMTARPAKPNSHLQCSFAVHIMILQLEEIRLEPYITYITQAKSKHARSNFSKMADSGQDATGCRCAYAWKGAAGQTMINGGAGAAHVPIASIYKQIWYQRQDPCHLKLVLPHIYMYMYIPKNGAWHPVSQPPQPVSEISSDRHSTRYHMHAIAAFLTECRHARM